ncbi:hypothetical protein PHMEG_00017286 [Phytophthora megakarya]|uniref:Uncharacterized protein n=1 Tax=Phytophthora megakarya TaxID=4795 RepID=A0A225VX64_9STRA|nr:hypothetical protein PHMEG_00017286 [Phytophthora megakarya]
MQDRERRLTAPARLEGLIDRSDLAYTVRTMTWRRLLRESRAGRESARLVRDALVTWLSDMVTTVGGSLNVTQLVRDLESRVEASTYVATPLPPELDPEYGVNRGLRFFRGLYHGRVGIYDARASGGGRDVASPYCVVCVVVSSISYHQSGRTYTLQSGWPRGSTPTTEPSFVDDSRQHCGDVAPAVRPFFTPVIPPFKIRAEWTRSRCTPWPRTRHTLSLTLDAQDPHFQPFPARYDVHLDHWAQAYWESMHEFLVPNTPARTRWRRRNSRRSHAGNHLVGTFQLLLTLFRAGRVDMDVLLDLMVLLFLPGRSSVGRWYPDLRNSTLEVALADIDAHEPWRCFFLTQPDASGNSTVEREHPA